MRPTGSIRRRSGGKGGLRRLALLLALLPLTQGGCDFQQRPERHPPVRGPVALEMAREVEDMLHASADSWNAGDLEGFLDDYWNSGELTFSGARGVTRGWERVRQGYLESYWVPGAVRDSLRFEGIEVLPLGLDHALALGRYVLFQPEGGGTERSSGYFTLVLRRMSGDWRIVHDHTSASPRGEPRPEEGS
jgi:uncharacterized protein (TIGR02246 family)